MSTHGALTEPSPPDSLTTPIGKGREGKGREEEACCRTVSCGSSNYYQIQSNGYLGAFAARLGLEIER